MNVPPPPSESNLLPWLLVALKPTSRTRIKEWLSGGLVLVNGTACTRHDTSVGPQDRIEIDHRLRERSGTDSLQILYRDDDLIAVEKPTGLLSVATEGEKIDTTFVRLKKRLDAERGGKPFVVHRLDRETSGVLLFARSPEMRDLIQSEWEGVEKTYLAVVEGCPEQDKGVIESHLIETRSLGVRIARQTEEGAKRALTRYQLLKKKGKFSLLEVVIETGRKHQIRVHLASIRCPVVGDNRYGSAPDPLRRLGLHAHQLVLRPPMVASVVSISAPIPSVFGRMFEIDPGESMPKHGDETPAQL